MKIRYVVGLQIFLISLLVACGAGPVPATAPVPTPWPTATVVDLPSPTPVPPAVEAVIQRVASVFGVSDTAIEVLSVEAVTWRDASLGCPEPGKMYAQVLTPGYRIVVRQAGTEYEFHTNESGETIVRCKDGQPAPLGATRGDTMMSDVVPSEAQDAFEAALKKVAEVSGVAQEAIALQSWEAVTWNDASLGCPEPGKMYAQVLTPGYRFIFDAGGDLYEIHTNRTGTSVVYCEDTSG